MCTTYLTYFEFPALIHITIHFCTLCKKGISHFLYLKSDSFLSCIWHRWSIWMWQCFYRWECCFMYCLYYDKSSLWQIKLVKCVVYNIYSRYLCGSYWGTLYTLFSGECNISMLLGSFCCLYRHTRVLN
jgi:hypothetical protein